MCPAQQWESCQRTLPRFAPHSPNPPRSLFRRGGRGAETSSLQPSAHDVAFCQDVLTVDNSVTVEEEQKPAAFNLLLMMSPSAKTCWQWGSAISPLEPGEELSILQACPLIRCWTPAKMCWKWGSTISPLEPGEELSILPACPLIRADSEEVPSLCCFEVKTFLVLVLCCLSVTVVLPIISQLSLCLTKPKIVNQFQKLLVGWTGWISWVQPVWCVDPIVLFWNVVAIPLATWYQKNPKMSWWNF